MHRSFLLGTVLAMVWATSGCCKSAQDSSAADAAAPSATLSQAAATVAPPSSAVGPTVVSPGKFIGSCMIMGMACSDYYGSPNDAVNKACLSASGK
jgi:hypothetical protein